MQSNLFRKQTLDRLTSPEQLNDYIRVANPSLWMTVGALLVLLCSFVVWGFLGQLQTTVGGYGTLEGGAVVCYLAPSEAVNVTPGMGARLNEEWNATVSRVDVEKDSGAEEGARVRVTLAFEGQAQSLPSYSVSIVTDSARPIDFLLR